VIAFLIIVYVAIVLVLFKVLHIKPTAYLIASMILLGVFMIGGVVVVWTQSAPITDKMVTSQYVVQLVPLRQRAGQDDPRPGKSTLEKR
jgi:membrane fusion protein, multidrug efflux system